tara:strand:- start:54 stop:566 length:513 start_codon:yes stop_codon:yes gene_type:complete
MATNLEFINKIEGDTVANLELTNIFSSKYDHYKIQIYEEEVGNSDYNYFRIINASGTDTGSNYAYSSHLMYSHTTYAQVKSTGTTTANYLGYLFPAGYDDGIGVTLDVYNPADTSSYTYFISSSASFANGVAYYGVKGWHIHKVEEAITGLSIERTGNFNRVKAIIYGVG